MRPIQAGNYVLPMFAMFLSLAAAPSFAADRDEVRLVEPVSEAYHSEVVAAIAERNQQFERNFAARETEKLIDDYFVPEDLDPKSGGG